MLTMDPGGNLVHVAAGEESREDHWEILVQMVALHLGCVLESPVKLWKGPGAKAEAQTHEIRNAVCGKSLASAL